MIKNKLTVLTIFFLALALLPTAFAQFGCCLDTCEGNALAVECSPTGFISEDFDCSSPAATVVCAQGCCVYLRADTIIFCDYDQSEFGQGKLARDCTADPPFSTNTEFFPGVIGTACNDICLQDSLPVGNLKGHVVDVNGNKLIDARVEAIQKGIADFTDNAGYELLKLPTGNQTVQITLAGYQPLTEILTVIDSETVFQNFTLTTTTVGSVAGRITDNLNQPLQDASVSWTGGSTFTDTQGNYKLDNVPAGLTTLSATKSGHNTVDKDVTIIAGVTAVKDFILTSTSGFCGDGQVQTGEQCDDGNNEDGDGCSSICLTEVCPQDQCFAFSYQCPGSEITDLSPTCDQDNEGSGCCNVPVEEIPLCINGQLTDQTIAETDVSASSGTRCQCANNYFDTANAEGRGYCCDDTFQFEPCSGAVGRLEGTVQGSDDIFLNGATIEIVKDGLLVSTLETFRNVNVVPVQDGFYSNNLPPGLYDLIGSADGYQPQTQTNVEIEAADITTVDLFLDLIPTECQGDIPPPSITLGNVQGQPTIEIAWDQTCLEEAVFLSFDVSRDSTLIFFTTDQAETSYTDENLAWGTTFSYTVTVNTLNKGSSSASAIINTGNELCENQAEFCLSTQLTATPPLVARAQCDAQNNLQIIEDCAFNDAICRQSFDVTWCSNQLACDTLATAYLEVVTKPNILGLFYFDVFDIKNEDGTINEDVSCEYEDSATNPRYCYLEKSDTTADTCLNCNQQDNCYDYQSKDACETDNCGYGPTANTQCEWQETVFGELGEGICYQQDY